jgi:hypothetical protein
MNIIELKDFYHMARGIIKFLHPLSSRVEESFAESFQAEASLKLDLPA